MNASPTDSAIFTALGTVAALVIGALRMNPPILRMGHHKRTTHLEMSAASMRTGCMGASRGLSR